MKKVLGIEIRFDLTKAGISIAKIINAIIKWNPSLQPSSFEDLYNYDYDIDSVDWDEKVHLNKLEELISENVEFSWLISVLDLEETGMKIKLKNNELNFSISLQDWSNPLVDSITHLIELLKAFTIPELVMFYNRNSDDAECIFVGVNNVRILAPITFINSNLISLTNSNNKFMEKFKDIIKLHSDGILIIYKNDFWRKSTKKEQRSVKDLEKYLQQIKS